MARTVYVGEKLNSGALEEISKLPDQPLAIINLLLYKEWADYPPGEVTEKLTGQQAYERYSELSIPFVNKVDGVPIWRGTFGVNMIGPEDEHWDEILIVQYPTRNAFISMYTDPGFLKIVHHRTAAVRDSRLYAATSPEAIGPMKWEIFKLSRKLFGK